MGSQPNNDSSEKEMSMHRQHAEGWSRREFLGGTLAGAAGLLGLNPEPLAAGNDNAQVRPERLGSL
ncbi:MAG: twin-arginine translocation signal domain-containing protein, partial [Thermodesulfobacteriota bacterium]